ncbi:hypothetical protein ABPG74_003679 [Tetrahymena malaccensis]
MENTAILAYRIFCMILFKNIAFAQMEECSAHLKTLVFHVLVYSLTVANVIHINAQLVQILPSHWLVKNQFNSFNQSFDNQIQQFYCILKGDSLSCTCQGYVQNGTCVPCTNTLKNCAQCDPTGKSCLSCVPNYGLITSSNSCYACSTIDKNCIQCDAKNTCLACTNGYTLQASSNTCVCNTSQTKFVVINNTCQSCQTASPNCKQFILFTQLSFFFNILKNFNCKYKKQLGSQCSLNSTSTTVVCTACNSPYVVSNGACQLCAAGSYRSGNSCVACADPNCSQCNSSGCYSCSNGYTLTQNTCTCTTAGYVIDSVDKKCKTCASKFNSSLCLNCNSTQCTQCGGTGFTPTSTGCSCQNGVQIPNTTICQGCTSNCSVCTLNSDNSTTTCTQCSSNYRLMANNTCQQCSSGKYYDKTSMSCLSCNANCSACPDNQGGGSCTACSNNYVLNSANGTCTCPSQITDSNNQCASCSTMYNQYCSTCNQYQCLTCQSNYYLQGQIFLLILNAKKKKKIDLYFFLTKLDSFVF